MVEERNWHGRDWKILRNNLIKLCLKGSDDLLAKIRSENVHVAGILEDFLTTVEQDILQKITYDQLGLWENTLSLFSDRKRIMEWLQKDIKALRGEKMYNGKAIKPRQALAWKLRQCFEQARRENQAIDQGVSVNKLKTWERLDRISRNLARKSNTKQRCTEEHFRELARFIKQNNAHDKNLPRRTNTIQGYFYQFSDDCFENIGNMGDKLDSLSIQEAKDLLTGVGIAELNRCLSQLSPDDLEIIDVNFKLGLGKIQYLSITDFLQARSLNTNLFEMRLKKIIEKLRDCLECSLQEQFRRNE